MHFIWFGSLRTHNMDASLAAAFSIAELQSIAPLKVVLHIVKTIRLCNSILDKYNTSLRLERQLQLQLQPTTTTNSNIIPATESDPSCESEHRSDSDLKLKQRHNQPTTTTLVSPPLLPALVTTFIVGLSGAASVALVCGLPPSFLGQDFYIAWTIILWLLTSYAPGKLFYRITKWAPIDFVLMLIDCYRKYINLLHDVNKGMTWRNAEAAVASSGSTDTNNNSKDYCYLTGIVVAAVGGTASTLVFEPAFLGSGLGRVWPGAPCELLVPTMHSKMPVFCAVLYVVLKMLEHHQNQLRSWWWWWWVTPENIIMVIYFSVHMFLYITATTKTKEAIATPLQLSEASRRREKQQ
eukprot:GEZU01016284.1.p1 GENE.GEZU01016284.1~~GEZU01016284.1.p1  ORF type:complete len:352 (-),score=30.49 GEZU01016284.1:42-1097(-)